jgi:hypothetical protein
MLIQTRLETTHGLSGFFPHQMMPGLAARAVGFYAQQSGTKVERASKKTNKCRF